MLYSVVHDPNVSANELNHDLKLINDWAYQWKMSFNPDVNKQEVEVLFLKQTKKGASSSPPPPPPPPPLFFNGNEILKVNEHKHIWVWYSILLYYFLVTSTKRLKLQDKT